MCQEIAKIVGPEGVIDRDQRPTTPEELERWLEAYTGIKIAKVAVCPGHQSPWECFTAIHLGRPPIALVLGSRGSGKSFLSALDTHLTSRWDPQHSTRILGGSKAQSEQIYRALHEIVSEYEGTEGGDLEAIAKLRKEGAFYVNGSEVAILAASRTSVRGPHVASLKLDEIDEMGDDIRESAMGMCMGRGKERKRVAPPVNASVIMTSTCHRVNGPMAKLIERAGRGDFPLYTMCVFEVLEHCDDSRSGPNLEKCPLCPIFRYCHDVPDGCTPKAKRSDGHYPIDSLIQKVRATGQRTFEADYLCQLSSSESAWFPTFAPETHVTPEAEFTPVFPVHLAVDTGVFTGAVLFQIIKPRTSDGELIPNDDGARDQIHVFADYLAENRSAEANARAIRVLSDSLALARREYATTDPAGRSRTAVGPTVLGEYEKVGLRLEPWPVGKVTDGLALVESFLAPAEGPPRLFVHPRCLALIQALQCYRRAKRGGQWLDMPADPQHPHEDLVDALRGGLKAAYPDGRGAAPKLVRVQARKVI
jgi:hypothetical protein